MSFVERFIVLCPYLGESTVGGSLYCLLDMLYIGGCELRTFWLMQTWKICTLFL